MNKIKKYVDFGCKLEKLVSNLMKKIMNMVKTLKSKKFIINFPKKSGLKSENYHNFSD